MVNSLTLLLLTFPVEGILIQQLGSDVFSKRESAQRALTAILQDTDGCRNYSVLLAVKKARDSEDKEVNLRAKSIYGTCYRKYFREYPYLCVFFEREGDEPLVKETADKLKRICAEAFGHSLVGVRWGRAPSKLFYVYRMPKDLDSVKLQRLKANKKVIRVVPQDNDDPEMKLLSK